MGWMEKSIGIARAQSSAAKTDGASVVNTVKKSSSGDNNSSGENSSIGCANLSASSFFGL